MSSDLSILGRDPRLYETASPALRKQVIKEVLANFAEGISYESCCWAADIPPDIFTQWRHESVQLEKACRRELAKLEKTYVRAMRGKPDETTGEKPSPAEMKFAHEALKQTNRYWAPKSAGAGIADGLSELVKLLPQETYALVVSTLSKHIDQ